MVGVVVYQVVENLVEDFLPLATLAIYVFYLAF